MNQEINPEIVRELLREANSDVQRGNTNPFIGETPSQGRGVPNYLPTVVHDDSAIERLKEDIQENQKNIKICIQSNLNMHHMVDDLSESQHEILNKVQQLLEEKTKIAEQCEVLCKQCCEKENASLREALEQLRAEVEDLKQANRSMLENAPQHDFHAKALHAARLDNSVERFVQLLKRANAERNMGTGRLVILRSM